MKINTANKRNLNFLLLFGVFSSFGCLEAQADPVFGIYKNKIHNTGNSRDIVKAKNGIYVNNFKKLRAQDKKNNLFKDIQSKSCPNMGYQNNIFRKWGNTQEGPYLTEDYQNDIFRRWSEEGVEGQQYFPNDIYRHWDDSIAEGYEDQLEYMDEYRSRLYPFHDYVFYDHYLSQMQSAKKDHHSFRKFLHNFRLHVSTGGSASFDKSVVSGFFFEENGNYYLSPLFQGRHNNFAYQVGWFGESYKKVPMTISSSKYSVLEAGEKFYTGWMGSWNILSLGVSYDVYKRLRLEIDFSFKGNHLAKLKRHYQVEKCKNNIHAHATPENVHIILLPKANSFSSDLAFLIGTKVVNTTLWSILLNFQTYFSFFYKDFNIVEGSFVHGLGNFYPGLGGGMIIERHLSDYISLFVKGMYGVSRFEWSEGGDDPKCKVMHWMSTFSLDFGINFTSSYVDQCEREEGCKIKEVHIHNSKEYRGLSKWEYKSPYGKVIHSVK